MEQCPENEHDWDTASPGVEVCDKCKLVRELEDDVFTADDLQRGSGDHAILGPAYFAARRASEALMQGVESDPLKRVADKVTEDMRMALYTYVEDYMRGDLEINLQSHIQKMVERTVRALLTGESWAMTQYPLAKYHDGEAIRKAVAVHGGEPLLMARIADLEQEVTRLTEALRWARS